MGKDDLSVYLLLVCIFFAGICVGVLVGWFNPVFGQEEEIECLDLSKPMYQHIHVWVKGIKIPANVGISPTCIQEIHTHSDKGILHLESHTPKNFTLEQFFDVWGMRLNPEIEWMIFIIINGKPATMDTVLKDNDVVVMRRQ